MIDLITKSLTGVHMMGTLILNESKLILLLSSWYLYLYIFHFINNHCQYLKYIFHVVFAVGIYVTISRLNQCTVIIKNWSAGVVVCNYMKLRMLLHENDSKKSETFLQESDFINNWNWKFKSWMRRCDTLNRYFSKTHAPHTPRLI